MSSRSPKTKAKKRDVLTGRDPVSQLYRAVRRYVEHNKGSIVVIGGIRVEQWPADREHCYHLAVKFMGRKPVLPVSAGEERG